MIGSTSLTNSFRPLTGRKVSEPHIKFLKHGLVGFRPLRGSKVTERAFREFVLAHPN